MALYKLTIEEYFQSNSQPSVKRFHNLKYIEKIADDVSGRTNGDKNHTGGTTVRMSAIKYSIADLVGFVKRYDEEFVFVPPKKGLTKDNIDVVFERYLQRENTANNLEIKTNEEYNGNISHSLKDDESIESEQHGVMWTIEENVLTKGEVSAFYSKISELRSKEYKSYRMSQDGDYIFEIGNKLIFSDGYYDFPTIYRVITFDTNNETVLGDARGFVYDAEETGAGQDSAFEIIEIVYGETFARTASYEDSRAYERENGRAKGTDSPETNRRSQKDVGKSYSLKDSEGNTLTEAQVEYFKDSKVRDENGNLLVCYHGTDAEFTVFDADFISDDNKLGNGFYFMAGKELQFSYAMLSISVNNKKKTPFLLGSLFCGAGRC